MERKMPDLSVFKLDFWKTILFQISTLGFAKNIFLTHTVNFGVGSTFSKGPESPVSESVGPSPLSIHK